MKDNNNDPILVAERIYRLKNPNSKMDVPSFAYEMTDRWHNEWMREESELDFYQWCLINKNK